MLPTSRLFSQSAGATKFAPTLYQVLAKLPENGVGARVTQRRWAAKGIEGSFWEVTRVRLKDEGKHGKVWGKLVWRGRPISERDELIRGGLKYQWEDVSSSMPSRQ
ncbi:hypothetical protein BOTBODRAFT_166639 [Botryobasidium botryosum FD-172 SS1]|uniref:Uncharacterized protein n=1 Tax=Botryobasidium botryosum (strain FD-172 SS1) TaxID=930990 RepID=A0A067M796_BOTB1|nr:hypothetical protein BOTBODRAFT_166639 [Botryobasidium botryosum FD-172 SS1]